MLDFGPDISAQRFVVPRAGHENQALRSGQSCKHSAGMIRWRINVVGAVHEHDGNLDLRGRLLRAYRTDIEVTLVLRKAEGALHNVGREKRRRTFCCHGLKIGEHFCGDDGGYARVKRRFLERDGRAERCADKNDRPSLEAIDDALEIPLLEESVGADIAWRFAMSATIVGDDIETACAETLNDAHRAAAIIGDAVEINDCASTRSGRMAAPAFEVDTIAAEGGILTTWWYPAADVTTRWMQEAAGSGSG